jgi:hypothetical protein
MIKRNFISVSVWCVVIVMTLSLDVFAQRKTKKKPAPAAPPSELSKLHEEFIQKTKE